jgi:hypothetical protein
MDGAPHHRIIQRSIILDCLATVDKKSDEWMIIAEAFERSMLIEAFSNQLE